MIKEFLRLTFEAGLSQRQISRSLKDDVKIQLCEHVRDDAGDSSGAVTDRYIDVERRERHRSAWKKPVLLN